MNVPASLERSLAAVDADLRRALRRAIEGEELDFEDGLAVATSRGFDLGVVAAVADECRRRDVGDVVTYVVNRNVNWTNICFVGCKFCAFAHYKYEAEAYNIPMERVLAKIAEGIDRGATEVCMQGGINPDMPGEGYFDILTAVKTAFPQIHVHAFSPMEIHYGAHRSGMKYRDFIARLQELGIGSIPGTAAEILDDDVREVLSHKKLAVAQWVEIITTAHALGVPTTSTVMYGHIETPMHVARHIDLIRTLQAETDGFTEFVPLRFIWQNTRLYSEGLVRPIPQGQLDLAVYATSRLMLRGLIDNVQTSWVKVGHKLAALTLLAGCNDLGGTLMEESISREAGADAGEYTSVEELCAMARSLGRIPRQRTTLYGLIDEPANGIHEIGNEGYAAGGWGGSS